MRVKRLFFIIAAVICAILSVFALSACNSKPAEKQDEEARWNNIYLFISKAGNSERDETTPWGNNVFDCYLKQNEDYWFFARRPLFATSGGSVSCKIVNYFLIELYYDKSALELIPLTVDEWENENESEFELQGGYLLKPKKAGETYISMHLKDTDVIRSMHLFVYDS